MDSLVRRIKDLDQVTFQQLCFHVISERYPSAKIRYPEGASGDEGVDLFQGDLTEGPTVWQCKAFAVTIVGDSQKRQIKESLRSAVKNVRPKLWILCLNLSLDTNAARWFQKLQKSYASHGIILADPFDAMDLARELLFRRTIRNHFFPNLTLDVQGIKSLVKAAATGMESIDTAGLEMLATENAEEYLDRLGSQDPRFYYEVTYGGDRGPSAFPPSNEPYLVSSMTDGRKIIKAYVRDHEALRGDPVKSFVRFDEPGGQKFLDFIRTGKEQTWSPDEIRAFKSTVPLLSQMKFAPGSLAMSVRYMPDDHIIPLKLTFSNGESRIELNYLEFFKVRAGVEEVEIATKSNQPFKITLVLPLNINSEATATISTNLSGQKIRDVARICNVLKALQAGCTMELRSLHLGDHLCTLLVDKFPISYGPGFFRFVEDLAAIAARFNVNLPMPSTLNLSREEEETFLVLRAFALNEPLELTRFTLSFVKCTENEKVIPECFRNEGQIRVEHRNSAATLFGTNIQLGANSIQIDRAEVIRLSAIMKKFKCAKIGDTVPIPVRPLVPVRFELMDRTDHLQPLS